MSSRNRYLNSEERQRALCLWKALTQAQQLVTGGERAVAKLEAAMHERLKSEGADSIEYARVVDCDTLADLEQLQQPANCADRGSRRHHATDR